MSNSLLAFAVLFECIRQRDWATAKALVPAAIGKETIDMCMCRVGRDRDGGGEGTTGPLVGGREGFPPSARLPYVLRVISELTDLGQLSAIGRAANDRWLRLCSADENAPLSFATGQLGAIPGDEHPAAAEVNQLRQVCRELEAQLDAAQALLLSYRRPPQLVERLIEACKSWDSGDSPIGDALLALEDADIFRATPEPELCDNGYWAAPDGDVGTWPMEGDALLDADDIFKGCSHPWHMSAIPEHACPSCGEPPPLPREEPEDDIPPPMEPDGDDVASLRAAGWALCDNGYWAAPGDEAGSWSTVDALRELDSGTVNQCHICHGPNDRAQALSTRCSSCHARAVHNRAVLDGIHSDTEAVLRGPRSSSR